MNWWIGIVCLLCSILIMEVDIMLNPNKTGWSRIKNILKGMLVMLYLSFQSIIQECERLGNEEDRS